MYESPAIAAYSSWRVKVSGSNSNAALSADTKFSATIGAAWELSWITRTGLCNLRRRGGGVWTRTHTAEGLDLL